jgi:hypothetical protein
MNIQQKTNCCFLKLEMGMAYFSKNPINPRRSRTLENKTDVL